jgi:tetratricopeptide (TPR) repeat protein
MRLRYTLALLAMPLFTAASAQPAPEQLGEVHFTTSCAPPVQPQFNEAVAFLHSFEFGRATDDFNSVLHADPSCTVAWWGVALSSWGNPFAANLRPQSQLDQGLHAVEQGRLKPPKTPRERDYIEVVAHLYADPAHLDQRSRILAYERSMAALQAANPDDVEAAIFYALSLAAGADPADKTYANQLKAGAILEDLFARYPNHPGLAHYIIHTYDVPSLASRASFAAKRYSEIAPSTPHALHMPSHTFTRLGQWQASIQANQASAAAARRENQPAEELHATDYMVYAYLQFAQDEAAHQLVESATQVFSRINSPGKTIGAASPAAGYFAHAAIPARYCLERHAWAEAAALQPYTSPYPYTDAITWFARGLGAAHLRDLATARASVDTLASLRDKLASSKEAYWSNQVEIQRKEVAAWIAFAQGSPQDALKLIHAAVEQEDATEKNVVTPGPLIPARELLGQLLLELNRPSEALREFQAALINEPNRLWSVFGAAQSARLAGDSKAAGTFSAQLLALTAHADPGRPELTQFRTALQPK